MANFKSFQDELNRYGQEGWEFAFVTEGRGSGSRYIIFKREIPADAPDIS